MTIKEQHKPWQVRLQGNDEAPFGGKEWSCQGERVFLRFLPQTKRICYLSAWLTCRCMCVH